MHRFELGVGGNVGVGVQRETRRVVAEHMERGDVERISWLVAHHHTYTNIDGPDHRILLEADFLVNAGESRYARSAIENFRQRVFRTSVGTELLDSMYWKGAGNL